MAELPEIVRQRLAQQAGGGHPDPDLLAAFAEGSLLARERTQVLAHLGVCAACRQVVWLALPQTPAPQAASAPATSSWLRWPVLRWGAAAAAVVIVATAVMLRMPQRKSPGFDERGIAPKQELSVPASAPPETEAKTGELAAPQPEKKAAAAARADRDKDKEAARHKLAAKSEAGIQAGAVQAEAYQAAEQLARKPAPPAIQVSGGQQAALDQLQQQRGQATQEFRQQSVTAAGQAAPPDLQAQNQIVAQQARPAPQAAPPPQARDKVVFGARAEQQRAMPAKDSAAMLHTQLRRTAVAPRWRVSSAGNLERSADSGATWHMVTVGQPANFRAVSAVGDDVWAAGAAGALFHSSDGGQTWTRVFPRSGEIALTSDIVRVEFTGALHGVLITASGETWATSDGGRTWAVRHD